MSRIALAMLLVHGCLLVWSAKVNSPTLDEPGNLVAGISYWHFGQFDIYKVNPPMSRAIAALQVAIQGDWDMNWRAFRGEPGMRPEFELGEEFVRLNGSRSIRYFTLARWACISFSLVGASLCYWWARDAYGSKGGLLSLALWCFSSSILAHGSIITPDVSATALAVASGYTFWRWLLSPSWTSTVVSGITLGLAELSKMTLLVFMPLWPVIWLIYRWRDAQIRSWSQWLRQLGMLGAQIVIAIYVLNLGYGFEGSLTRLGEFRFVSASLGGSQPEGVMAHGGNKFAESWLSMVPVPLPKHYVLGFDLQKRDFEDYPHSSYLGGEFSERGWWYYYLYALAIKVPLGTWLLVALAACARLFISPVARLRDEFVLLCPAVVILVFVSSQTGFSEHMRYVLPAFPFVFVWIGRLAPVFDRRHLVMASIATAALGWSITSSLWVYPHSLSYFNELVGGPTGGPKHLIHSNVDWGQDLLNLKRWLGEHPEARPLKLAYFGYFDPIHADIEYTAPGAIEPGEEIPPGWYAVSVNFVRGFPYFVYQGDGTKAQLKQGALAAFQRLEPVAMAGYSIYIYHVPDSSLNEQ